MVGNQVQPRQTIQSISSRELAIYNFGFGLIYLLAYLSMKKTIADGYSLEYVFWELGLYIIIFGTLVLVCTLCILIEDFSRIYKKFASKEDYSCLS